VVEGAVVEVAGQAHPGLGNASAVREGGEVVFEQLFDTSRAVKASSLND
jgi:hypothetical protein